MRSNFYARFRRGVQRVRLCLGIVVTISSAACTPSPDQARFTVEYYRTNGQAREAKLAECTNDPGGLGRTPDCVNAREAARMEGIGSLRDLPSMGLPTTTEPAPDRDPPEQ